MLHAAAMLGGLALLWAALAGESSSQAWALAVGASVLCVLVALRFGGASAAYWRAPGAVWLGVTRAGAVMRGAFSIIRRAVSADVTLNPALVRVITRSPHARARAAFAHVLGAAPGMAVVDTDADGLLLHVIDEDRVDAADLGRLESATGASVGTSP